MNPTQLANAVAELDAQQLEDFLNDLHNNMSIPFERIYRETEDEAGINCLFHLREAAAEWTNRKGN